MEGEEFCAVCRRAQKKANLRVVLKERKKLKEDTLEARIMAAAVKEMTKELQDQQAAQKELDDAQRAYEEIRAPNQVLEAVEKRLSKVDLTSKPKTAVLSSPAQTKPV